MSVICSCTIFSLAFRVLSDPHERAWYDSHRTQILQTGGRGTQMGSSAGYEEQRVDVFQYFTRSCFRAFDDRADSITEDILQNRFILVLLDDMCPVRQLNSAPILLLSQGFYTVYQKVFENIAEEELRVTAFNASDDDQSTTDEDADCKGEISARTYPTFGRSDSPYIEVVAPFYQFWEMFRTRKSYTWLEKYDTRCAESRPERRAMEAENRRIRNAARKKRNEEIRELVAFVKKRDKRVAAERERLQLANQEVHARSQQMAKQARLRSATQLAEAWNEELAFGGIAAQWAEDFEAELARMEADLDGLHIQSDDQDKKGHHSEETDVENLYCLACDKVFASVKSKENHETSKKHRKQAEILRQILLADEEAATAATDHHGGEPVTGRTSDAQSSSVEDTEPVVEVKLTKRAKKAQRKRERETEKHNAARTASENPEASVPIQATVPSALPEKARKPTTKCSEIRPPSLVCEVCTTEFPSRNQLFAHLKSTGHAVVKRPANSASRPKTKNKPK
ncbi:DnaJ subfamily A member 5 [Paragonimus westermani]|uniref:DnaJ subfamily A member 5 n=1 Tax=Paragonimus westermani TaxID=34504 RepID=A0A5J4NAT2_9TREM|nr:DnaJ subfamily A member 5 [Paragonimus westermani]